MPLSTGVVIQDRYRIDEVLGKGGFGTVYRVHDVKLDCDWAMKENLDISEDAQRQFMREARMLAALRHPNLARVTDYFILPERGQYLVMDFIEGEDLAHRLISEGPLPVNSVMDALLQIGSALIYLHRQDPPIIHRDIKPANIKITPQGQAVLVDFGIAKHYDPARRTTAAAQAVTPGFSPLEQYGMSPTDARSDIYALAATAYCLMAGHPPPDAIARATGAPILDLCEIIPALPPQAGEAIMSALSMEPYMRPLTVEQFLTELSPSRPLALEAYASALSSDPRLPLAGGLVADAARPVSSINSKTPPQMPGVGRLSSTPPALAATLPPSGTMPPSGQTPAQPMPAPRQGGNGQGWVLAGLGVAGLLGILAFFGVMAVLFIIWLGSQETPTPGPAAKASSTPRVVASAPTLKANATPEPGAVEASTPMAAVSGPAALFPLTGSAQNAVVAGSLAYIADGSEGVGVVDISDPANPRLISQMDLTGWAFDAALKENILLVAAGSGGLKLLDVADPANPRLVGELDNGDVHHVALVDNLAYLASTENGLVIADISDPANPREVSRLPLDNQPQSIAVANNVAFLAAQNAGLHVVDVSDPAKPKQLVTYVSASWAYDVVVARGAAFVTLGDEGLVILDISNPADPAQLGKIDTDGWSYGVTLNEDATQAYVADGGGGLTVVNVEDLTRPTPSGTVKAPHIVNGVALTGNILVLACGKGGMATAQLPVKGKDDSVVGQLGGSVETVAAAGSVLYLGVGGRMVALDLSNPADPQWIGQSPVLQGQVKEIALNEQMAFLAADRGGLHVLDLTQAGYPELYSLKTSGSAQTVTLFEDKLYVSDSIEGIGGLDAANPEVWGANGAYRELADYRSLAARDNLLFVSDINGLKILDFSSKTFVAGQLKLPDADMGDLVLSGDLLFLACGGEGVRAVDISNPAKPVVVGQIDTQGWARGLALSGSTLFVADSFGGLKVLDVSDPAKMREMAKLELGGGDVTAAAVNGEYLYLAAGSGGLYVVNVARPASPQQVFHAP